MFRTAILEIRKEQESPPHTENIENTREMASSFQTVTTLPVLRHLSIHLTNWCLLSLSWKMLPWCGNISVAMTSKPPDGHACGSDKQDFWHSTDWILHVFPQIPVHNTRPKWFLNPDLPFVQLSVLNLFHCGYSKALSSGGDTEHCRGCSSLQTYFCSLSFDDSLIPVGPNLKTVLHLAEPSGLGSLFSSQNTPTFKP